MIVLKSRDEIEKMRAAGRIVADALTELAAGIVPGKDDHQGIHNLADGIIRRENAISSFKGYRGYPAVACIAVNDEVVHGIPGGRILEPGDIVGIDLGAILNGFHGDSAITVAVGAVSDDAQKLMD